MKELAVHRVDFKKLRRIFFVTFRIGMFTFGGGYSMIPMMQKDFVDKNGWITEEDIVDVFAVSQSLPGVIAVNASVMIGYKIAGVLGGLAAALGSALPSLLVLMVVTALYEGFITNPYVLGFLRGVRGAVVALMVSAVVKLYKQSVKDAVALGLFVLTVLLSFFFQQIHPIFFIIGGGVAGFFLQKILRKREEIKLRKGDDR
ncbi:chromate transporter [Oscillospiraceae bacterium OttesenSCG-928-F05]|nr:chromate transporter [Oscillospiraceae bacterium OttesenSCG-928-F05]